MSTIKVNKILSANNPVVDVADGLTVTGEVKVGSAVTSNSTGIDVTGVVTATSFKGDGSTLTGIDASSIKFGGAVKVQANNSGAVVSGILTVNQDNDRTTFMTGNSVGVGTTNTAGRNAGVSTAA